MLVAGTLDEVAWLLNVRGDDIPNCPLAVAYAVLERVGNGAGDSAKARPLVFVEEGKLGPEARRHLVDDCGAEVCGDLFLVYCLWWADTGRLWAGLCWHTLPHNKNDTNRQTTHRSGRTGTSLATLPTR